MILKINEYYFPQKWEILRNKPNSNFILNYLFLLYLKIFFNDFVINCV